MHADFEATCHSLRERLEPNRFLDSELSLETISDLDLRSARCACCLGMNETPSTRSRPLNALP